MAFIFQLQGDSVGMIKMDTPDKPCFINEIFSEPSSETLVYILLARTCSMSMSRWEKKKKNLGRYFDFSIAVKEKSRKEGINNGSYAAKP